MDFIPDKWLVKLLGDFPPPIIHFLKENCTYFKHLKWANKEIFVARMKVIMQGFNFIDADGVPSAKEQALLVAAGICQLTFGYKRYLFEYGKEIILKENSYTLLNYDGLFHGHVQGKYMYLSIPAIKEGFKENSDGINIVLHEVAHLLVLENKHNKHKFFNAQHTAIWDLIAEEKIRLIRSGQETFFRQYGGINEMEFFAVAVESFFERPEEFYSKHPDLYRTARLLLQQDPRNKRNPLSFIY